MFNKYSNNLKYAHALNDFFNLVSISTFLPGFLKVWLEHYLIYDFEIWFTCLKWENVNLYHCFSSKASLKQYPLHNQK